jgi:type II secretory pathway pseudopilin PulG
MKTSKETRFRAEEARKVHLVPRSAEGFTLIETMIAMLVVTFGLLAAGQMIYVSVASASLARSKGSAAVVAQSKLEELSALYSSNPAAADLTDGAHGPQQVQIINPANNNSVLNRFSVSWTVNTVPDPRPGWVLTAIQLSVTVTPVDAANNNNRSAFLNKIVTVTAVFSPRHAG